MKVHYTKILLFFFPLNILLTLYQAHNKNKIYITPHHTQTNRSLCECETQSSNYDKDTGMKSVMQQFVDRTSQRFEEYKERMKNKRQKHKEQRDKNIQKIIEKDKREKSLAEKVEIGCLRCGCGLGGVAASVGIFGTVAVKELTKSAIAAAADKALKDTSLAVAAAAKGAAAGKEFVIAGITREFGVSSLGDTALETYITATNYIDVKNIALAIIKQYDPSSCVLPGSGAHKSICPWVTEKFFAERKISEMIPGNAFSMNDFIKKTVENIVSDAKSVAETAAQQATKDVIKISTDAAESAYAGSQTAIIASVVAILIIALVMIIIYLVLRYRRKRKMNKKAQYTKILNQ
ncbi:rifin PIR protein,putative [Plasmodium sp. DRC-Itaito]|nr:rifin PIR protein,putative [Plasmodium sp. DRC-Itaito]